MNIDICPTNPSSTESPGLGSSRQHQLESASVPSFPSTAYCVTHFDGFRQIVFARRPSETVGTAGSDIEMKPTLRERLLMTQREIADDNRGSVIVV